MKCICWNCKIQINVEYVHINNRICMLLLKKLINKQYDDTTFLKHDFSSFSTKRRLHNLATTKNVSMNNMHSNIYVIFLCNIY